MDVYVLYKDLKIEYDKNRKIPYDKLLRTYEWKKFRDLIVKRDNNKCCICDLNESIKYGKFYIRKPTEEEKLLSEEKYSLLINNSDVEFSPKFTIMTGVIDSDPIILHVHHSYYIFNHLPWEYDIDSLVTVCHKCHRNIHQNLNIPMYKDRSKSEVLKLTPCEKCHGTGFVEKFYYYENGLCFECMGNKFIEYCN